MTLMVGFFIFETLETNFLLMFFVPKSFYFYFFHPVVILSHVSFLLFFFYSLFYIFFFPKSKNFLKFKILPRPYIHQMSITPRYLLFLSPGNRIMELVERTQPKTWGEDTSLPFTASTILLALFFSYSSILTQRSQGQRSGKFFYVLLKSS